MECMELVGRTASSILTCFSYFDDFSLILHTTVAFPFPEFKIAVIKVGSFSLPHENVSEVVTHSSSFSMGMERYKSID
jgi:hypothetical protein